MVDFEFACQDDCLEKMVPSDLRQLVAERDALKFKVAQLTAEINDLQQIYGNILTEHNKLIVMVDDAYRRACRSNW